MKKFLPSFIVALLGWITCSGQWYLTSYDVYDVEFVDANTGYVTGTGGTIKKTSDGGQNWYLLDSKTTLDLFDAEFVTANQGFVGGVEGVLLKTTDGGNTWTELNNPFKVAVTHIKCIDFVDASTGYILDDDGFYSKTTDGGDTWSSRVNTKCGFTNSADYNSIRFTSNMIGYAFSPTSMTKTTDGGANWNFITLVNANYAVFFDDDNGIASGYTTTSRIHKTTNGGNSWNTVDLGISQKIQRLSFIDQNTGFAVLQGGMVYKTTDAGINWNPVNTGMNHTLNAIAPLSANDLVVVGSEGVIMETSNGGTNWNYQTITPHTGLDEYNAVCFTDSLTWYIASGTGDVLKSTDGAISWSVQNTTNTSSLNGIFFPSTSVGYAVGYAGKIVKTTNGGTSWSDQVSGITNQLNDVYFIDDNNGIAVGDWGTILRTTDGGSNWMSISTPTNDEFMSVTFTTAQKGFIVGESDELYTTTNGGANWTPALPFTVPGNHNDVFFIDPVNGFIAGSKFYATSDSGNTWTEISAGDDLKAVWFFDDMNGYAVDIDLGLYKTTDGGANWIGETKKLFSCHMTDIAFATPTKGIAIGEDGIIFQRGFYSGGGASSVNGLSTSGDFKIYPNPTTGQFKIHLNGLGSNERAEIIIYSITGRIIYRTEVRTNFVELNLQDEPRGMYFISLIKNEKYTRTSKILLN